MVHAAPVSASVDLGAAVSFVRSPVIVPRYPGRKFEAPQAPKRNRAQRMPLVMLLIPLMMALVLYLFTHQVLAVLFAALSPLMLVGGVVESRRAQKADFKEARAAYDADLASLATELGAAVEEEQQVRNAEQPTSAGLLAAADRREPLMWSRRPGDDDFLCVRLGACPLPSRSTVDVPRASPARRRSSCGRRPATWPRSTSWSMVCRSSVTSARVRSVSPDLDEPRSPFSAAWSSRSPPFIRGRGGHRGAVLAGDGGRLGLAEVAAAHLGAAEPCGFAPPGDHAGRRGGARQRPRGARPASRGRLRRLGGGPGCAAARRGRLPGGPQPGRRPRRSRSPGRGARAVVGGRGIAAAGSVPHVRGRRARRGAGLRRLRRAPGPAGRRRRRAGHGRLARRLGQGTRAGHRPRCPHPRRQRHPAERQPAQHAGRQSR